MITLPTSPLPPTRTWPRVLFLYGQPKVGKTTILSQLENCLIIECDPCGADYVSALKVQVNTMGEYDAVVKELIAQKKPYKFVALDTSTKLEEWCEPLATQDYKESAQGKNFKGESVLTILSSEGFSPGYNWLRLAFQRKMAELMRTADNIILVGHMKEKYLKSFDTKEKGKDSTDVYSRDIDHTGKIKSMIATGADAIGFLYRSVNPSDNSQKLKVSFKTLEAVNCGTRCSHLVGKEFDFDWNLIYPEQPISK